MNAEIYPDIPEEEYRNALGENITGLKHMLLSPAHYKYRKDETDPDKEKVQLIIGTLVHRAKFERDKFAYVVRPKEFDSWRTKASQEWRDSQTLPVVTAEEEDDIIRCVDALENCELLNELAARGQAEVAAFKIHEKTGLRMKGRADLWTVDDGGRRWLIDLKTVPEGGASREAFRAKIDTLNYALQAAYYCDLFGTDNFLFVAVEKKGFPGVGTYQLTPDDLDVARQVNNRLLERLADCIAKDDWPSYTTDAVTLPMSDYKRRKMLEILQ